MCRKSVNRLTNTITPAYHAKEIQIIEIYFSIVRAPFNFQTRIKKIVKVIIPIIIISYINNS